MKRKRIVVTMIFLLILCGCGRKTYSACVNQPIENVASIELLDTKDDEETVLYTLSDSEYASFWSQFKQISFSKYYNDPPTQYGILAVKITYSDGCVDIIGTDINCYYNAAGKGMRTGWYCAVNDGDFVSLFEQYIDASVSTN